MRFRFFNFELGYSNGSTLLVGWSNKVYGKPSRWSDSQQAQCVEVEVKDEKEYLAMAIDLKMAWHLPMRLWVPVPEFAQPLSHSVAEFQAGYNLGMDGRPLPDEASSNARAGYVAAGLKPLKTDPDYVDALKNAMPDIPKEKDVELAKLNGTETPNVNVIPADQPLSSMKFFALRKIAKDEGVDISACEGVPQIIAAIEEHRKQQTA